MSLNARLTRLAQRAHSDGLQQTIPVIFSEPDEEIPRLIAQATVCPCCAVHVARPTKEPRCVSHAFSVACNASNGSTSGRWPPKRGKPYGFSADNMLDEARRLIALSAAEQDAECAGALAQAQARGDREAVHLLTQGWAAIRSYR